MGYKNLFSWHNDHVTENQLLLIKRIISESDLPLPPFTGKTKGEASKWIAENQKKARHGYVVLET